MKNIRRFILAFLGALSLSLLVLAGCGSGAEKAELTLDADGVGTLTKSEYTVEVGSNLKDLLKDVTPQAQNGFTFEGWFNGDTPIGDDDTMPAGGLKLTAKYQTTYTVAIYKETAALGVYPAAADEQTTHSARYKSTVTYDLAPVTGYELDVAKPNVLSGTVGVNTVLTVYLKRASFRVGYEVNLPEGAEAEGSVEAAYARFGTETALADGKGFRAPANLRFLGWSLTADGEVQYHAGDNFPVNGDTKLYAVWQKGITDVFEISDDVLFPSTEEGEENVIYLRRAGFDGDVAGVLNDGRFSFKEEDREVLAGAILPSGTRFFYYKEIGTGTFAAADGTGASLRLEREKAFLTEDGEVTEGTYSVDELTREYIFESEESEFRFQLGLSGGDYVFYRENAARGPERGFYIYKNAEGEIEDNILFLDGMVDGNGIATATAYTLEDGTLVPVRMFYYSLDTAVEGLYHVFDAEGERLFGLRLDAYEGEAGGRRLKGAFRTSDGYEQLSYVLYDEMFFSDDVGRHYLTVDGFGNGAITLQKTSGGGETVRGTYVLKMFTFNEFSSYVGNFTGGQEWMEFTTEAGQKLLLSVHSIVYNADPYYLVLSEEPYMQDWAGSPVSIYGENDMHGSLPQNAAFLFEGNGVAYVYAWFVDTGIGDKVYENIDSGTVEEVGGGEYIFTSSLYGFHFSFREEEGLIVVSPRDIIELTTTDGALSLDSWGALTYGGKTYPYGEWTVEAIGEGTKEIEGKENNLYIFTFGGETHYVKVESGAQNEPVYTLLSHRAVYDIALKQYAMQQQGFERMYFPDANWETAAQTEAGAECVIALRLTSGAEEFVIYGTAHKFTSDYLFRSAISEEDLLGLGVTQEMIDALSAFRFVPDAAAGQLLVSDRFTLTAEGDTGSLKLDGYGKGVFTPEGGAPVAGSYDYLATRKDGSEFILFTEENGKTHYFSVVQSDDPYFIESADEMAGLRYYFYTLDSESYGIYYDAYIVIFGDGELWYGTDARGNDVYGTYTPTARAVVSYLGMDWDEYLVTISAVDRDGILQTESFTIIMAQVPFSVGTEYVYRERDEAQVLNYIVEGGGYIRGNGYDAATYSDGEIVYYGEMSRVDVYDRSPLYEDYRAENNFENGKQILFHAYYAERNGEQVVFGSYESLLFDIIDDGVAALRDDYSGTYAYFTRGARNEQTMYLDGHGNATLYAADGSVTETGSYALAPEVDEYTMVYSGTTTFRFRLASILDVNSTWLIYNKIEDETVYTTEDWAILLLSGYGYYVDDEGNPYCAMYVDEWGTITYGASYSYKTDTLVQFETLDGDITFFDLKDGSFSINHEEFIVRDGVLYGYQGPKEIIGDLIIPEDVRVIGDYAMMTLTKIGPADGWHTSTIQLNNVEKIGKYAFANIKTFNIVSLSSDKLVEIDDYAFSWRDVNGTAAGGNAGVNALQNVNFPNVKRVGNYAFYGVHSLGLGMVTLGAVTEIGEYAFTHPAMISGERMTLDLRSVDLSKLSIADTALVILDRNNNLKEMFGIKVLVSGIAGVAFRDSLPEGAREYVVVSSDYTTENVFEGKAILDFEGGVLYVLGQPTESEGIFAATKYLYNAEDNIWSEGSGSAFYGVSSAQGVEFITEAGVSASFQSTATSVEIGGQTFLFTSAEHTMSVTKDGETSELAFSFTVEVQSDILGGTNVALRFEDVRLDGEPDLYGSPYFDGVLTLYFVEEADLVKVTVDLGGKTAESAVSGAVLYSGDQAYRGVFTRPIMGEEGAYLTLELAKKQESGEYVFLTEGGTNRNSNDPENIFWTFTVTAGDRQTIYTVHISSETSELVVDTREIYAQTDVCDAENLYRASFTGESLETMDSLTKFEVYDTKYSYWTEQRGIATKVGENTFEVAVHNLYENGKRISRVYTVIFHAAAGGAASIEVSYKDYLQYTVYTAGRDEQKPHYSLTILANEEGEIYGLTGSIRSYEWSTANEWWDDEFVADIPVSGVTKEGNTFTFTLASDARTFTITVEAVHGEDGALSFTATLTITNG